MRIVDLLKKQSIDLNAAVADKTAAIGHLVDLMDAGGNLNDKALYKERVLAREAEGSTGIGEGIAIPHAKTAVSYTHLDVYKRQAPIHTALTAYDLLRRADVNYESLQTVFDLPDLQEDVEEEIEIMIKYEGYISRQMEQVDKMNRLEKKKMPEGIIYADIDTLSAEARQKLDEIRPLSLGQASRISGVSPADITALLILLEQHNRGDK